MGQDFNKQVADTLHHPEKRKKVESLFKKLDTDKNGTLNKAEFKIFGERLFYVDIQDAKTKNEHDFADKPVAAENLNALIDVMVTPQKLADFIEKMFEVADKDHNGELSFEEFEAFLRDHFKLEGVERLDHKA